MGTVLGAGGAAYAAHSAGGGGLASFGAAMLGAYTGNKVENELTGKKKDKKDKKHKKNKEKHGGYHKRRGSHSSSSSSSDSD